MRDFRFHLITPILALALTAPVAAAQTTDSLKAAVVNDEQTDRGDKVYSKVCVECHTKTDYTGSDFRIKWNGRPVFDLFERIRTTMPDANPGSMTRDEYIDVVAYLLKLNGAPSGGEPLLPDSAALAKVRMEIAPPKPPGTSGSALSAPVFPNAVLGSVALPGAQSIRVPLSIPAHARLH